MKKPLIILGAVATLVFGAHALLPKHNPYLPPSSFCDSSLWNHVYSGDPRRFKVPQDRLQVIEDCKTVEGVLKTAKMEADGDWHLRLDVTDKTLLNDKNISGQQGMLVLEPICENPITQKDTISEHACDNFSQSVFNKSMLGKRVRVVGAYVTDMEHGWRELHPVTSITIIQ